MNSIFLIFRSLNFISVIFKYSTASISYIKLVKTENSSEEEAHYRMRNKYYTLISDKYTKINKSSKSNSSQNYQKYLNYKNLPEKYDLNILNYIMNNFIVFLDLMYNENKQDIQENISKTSKYPYYNFKLEEINHIIKEAKKKNIIILDSFKDHFLKYLINETQESKFGSQYDKYFKNILSILEKNINRLFNIKPIKKEELSIKENKIFLEDNPQEMQKNHSVLFKLYSNVKRMSKRKINTEKLSKENILFWEHIFYLLRIVNELDFNNLSNIKPDSVSPDYINNREEGLPTNYLKSSNEMDDTEITRKNDKVENSGNFRTAESTSLHITSILNSLSHGNSNLQNPLYIEKQEDSVIKNDYKIESNNILCIDRAQEGCSSNENNVNSDKISENIQPFSEQILSKKNMCIEKTESLVKKNNSVPCCDSISNFENKFSNSKIDVNTDTLEISTSFPSEGSNEIETFTPVIPKLVKPEPDINKNELDPFQQNIKYEPNYNELEQSEMNRAIEQEFIIPMFENIRIDKVEKNRKFPKNSKLGSLGSCDLIQESNSSNEDLLVISKKKKSSNKASPLSVQDSGKNIQPDLKHQENFNYSHIDKDETLDTSNIEENYEYPENLVVNNKIVENHINSPFNESRKRDDFSIPKSNTYETDTNNIQENLTEYKETKILNFECDLSDLNFRENKVPLIVDFEVDLSDQSTIPIKNDRYDDFLVDRENNDFEFLKTPPPTQENELKRFENGNSEIDLKNHRKEFLEDEYPHEYDNNRGTYSNEDLKNPLNNIFDELNTENMENKVLGEDSQKINDKTLIFVPRKVIKNDFESFLLGPIDGITGGEGLETVEESLNENVGQSLEDYEMINKTKSSGHQETEHNKITTLKVNEENKTVNGNLEWDNELINEKFCEKDKIKNIDKFNDDKNEINTVMENFSGPPINHKNKNSTDEYNKNTENMPLGKKIEVKGVPIKYWNIDNLDKRPNNYYENQNPNEIQNVAFSKPTYSSFLPIFHKRKHPKKDKNIKNDFDKFRGQLGSKNNLKDKEIFIGDPVQNTYYNEDEHSRKTMSPLPIYTPILRNYQNQMFQERIREENFSPHSVPHIFHEQQKEKNSRNLNRNYYKNSASYNTLNDLKKKVETSYYPSDRCRLPNSVNEYDRPPIYYEEIRNQIPEQFSDYEYSHSPSPILNAKKSYITRRISKYRRRRKNNISESQYFENYEYSSSDHSSFYYPNERTVSVPNNYSSRYSNGRNNYKVEKKTKSSTFIGDTTSDENPYEKIFEGSKSKYHKKDAIERYNSY